MQKHFIAQNQSRIINCKRCLYLYPDIYPSPFSREYHTGKYWFLNKSKSSNLLIINPAEIAQLVSLERRSLFRPWSSNPCQGWGREFESRFPLQFQPHFDGAVFVYISVLCCYGVAVLPFRKPHKEFIAKIGSMIKD